MIYFIQQVGHAPIKIGCSHDPFLRLSSLQSGNPRQLRIIAVLNVPDHIESYLHYRYRASHIRGEWYRETPSLSTLIQRVQEDQVDREKLLAAAATLGTATEAPHAP